MPDKNYFHIKYEKTELSYQKFGNGPKTLLAFHGYGQNSEALLPIGKALGDLYTVYSFDLFFHGKSKWLNGEIPLEKAYWQRIMNAFFQTYNIQQYSLLGYSMGAKFVLALLEYHPDKIEKVWLMAPDGIKTNGWYSLATYPFFLRKIFKSIITKPKILFILIKLLHAIKLLDRGLMKFVRLEMDNEEKRRRVYFSWVVFRHLSFDITHISNLINKHHISVTIILGKFDKVITKPNMHGLIKGLQTHRLVELDCGHHNLIHHSASVYDAETDSFKTKSL